MVRWKSRPVRRCVATGGLIVFALFAVRIFKSSQSNSQTPPGPPAVSIVADSAVLVEMSWHPVPGAQYYQVFGGASPSFAADYYHVLGDGLRTPSFMDDSATAGTTHYYKVYAVNKAGTSTLIGEGSATTPGTASATDQIRNVIQSIRNPANLRAAAVVAIFVGAFLLWRILWRDPVTAGQSKANALTVNSVDPNAPRSAPESTPLEYAQSPLVGEKSHAMFNAASLAIFASLMQIPWAVFGLSELMFGSRGPFVFLQAAPGTTPAQYAIGKTIFVMPSIVGLFAGCFALMTNRAGWRFNAAVIAVVLALPVLIPTVLGSAGAIEVLSACATWLIGLWYS